MSALIAYEPTQDSEVLADTFENDGSGFWNPTFIYVSQNPERSYWECEWRFPSTGTVVLITLDGDESGPTAESRQFFSACRDASKQILALCLPVLEELYAQSDMDSMRDAQVSGTADRRQNPPAHPASSVRIMGG